MTCRKWIVFARYIYEMGKSTTLAVIIISLSQLASRWRFGAFTLSRQHSIKPYGRQSRGFRTDGSNFVNIGISWQRRSGGKGFRLLFSSLIY